MSQNNSNSLRNSSISFDCFFLAKRDEKEGSFGVQRKAGKKKRKKERKCYIESSYKNTGLGHSKARCKD